MNCTWIFEDLFQTVKPMLIYVEKMRKGLNFSFVGSIEIEVQTIIIHTGELT